MSCEDTSGEQRYFSLNCLKEINFAPAVVAVCRNVFISQIIVSCYCKAKQRKPLRLLVFFVGYFFVSLLLLFCNCSVPSFVGLIFPNPLSFRADITSSSVLCGVVSGGMAEGDVGFSPQVFVVNSQSKCAYMPRKNKPIWARVGQKVLLLLVAVTMFGLVVQGFFIYFLYRKTEVSVPVCLCGERESVWKLVWLEFPLFSLRHSETETLNITACGQLCVLYI